MVLCKNCWMSIEHEGQYICSIDYYVYEADDDRGCDGFLQKGKGYFVTLDVDHSEE